MHGDIRMVMKVNNVLGFVALVSVVCLIFQFISSAKDREEHTRLEKAIVSLTNLTRELHQLTLCSSSKPCRVFHKSVHQTRCFRKVTRPALSWKDAKLACSKMGGFLAEVEDMDTLQFIKEMYLATDSMRRDDSLLLGGRRDDEGRWRWATSGHSIRLDDWVSEEEKHQVRFCRVHQRVIL